MDENILTGVASVWRDTYRIEQKQEKKWKSEKRETRLYYTVIKVNFKAFPSHGTYWNIVY